VGVLDLTPHLEEVRLLLGENDEAFLVLELLEIDVELVANGELSTLRNSWSGMVPSLLKPTSTITSFSRMPVTVPRTI
jgi:hypothetical protein